MFRVFGRDPAKLDRLGDVFVRQYDTQFSRLAEALHENDIKQVRHQLHSIKGMAALIGAEAAGEIVLSLESMVEGAANEATPNLVNDAMVLAVGNLRDALLPYRRWFSQRGNALPS
jgi:HPt (histidine-containing phosphotransfer) domain-containing protein